MVPQFIGGGSKPAGVTVYSSFLLSLTDIVMLLSTAFIVRILCRYLIFYIVVNFIDMAIIGVFFHIPYLYCCCVGKYPTTVTLTSIGSLVST